MSSNLLISQVVTDPHSCRDTVSTALHSTLHSTTSLLTAGTCGSRALKNPYLQQSDLPACSLRPSRSCIVPPKHVFFSGSEICLRSSCSCIPLREVVQAVGCPCALQSSLILPHLSKMSKISLFRLHVIRRRFLR